MRRLLAGTLVTLALASAGAPVRLSAQVPQSENAALRAALAGAIDSGVVVAFGAPEPVNYWPTFQQHAKAGDAFDLKKYNDQVLSYGSPPVKYVRESMGL
jgi:hypothetical protein